MTDFFAVIYVTSVTVPGDERSRNNPGHGYPEHTVDTDTIHRFPSEEKFKEWIEKEEKKQYGKRLYQAIRCTPITITTTVNIDIGGTAKG